MDLMLYKYHSFSKKFYLIIFQYKFLYFLPYLLMSSSKTLSHQNDKKSLLFYSSCHEKYFLNLTFLINSTTFAQLQATKIFNALIEFFILLVLILVLYISIKIPSKIFEPQISTTYTQKFGRKKILI